MEIKKKKKHTFSACLSRFQGGKCLLFVFRVKYLKSCYRKTKNVTTPRLFTRVKVWQEEGVVGFTWSLSVGSENKASFPGGEAVATVRHCERLKVTVLQSVRVDSSVDWWFHQVDVDSFSTNFSEVKYQTEYQRRGDFRKLRQSSCLRLNFFEQIWNKTFTTRQQLLNPRVPSSSLLYSLLHFNMNIN